MKTNIYTLTEGRTLEGMAAAVERLLRANSMNVQKLELKNDSFILQAREHDGKLLQIVGADVAITVKMRIRSGNTVIVEVGEGKWLDKLGGLAVSWFFTWIALPATIMGAYNQFRLPEKIHKCIQNYLYEEKITVQNGAVTVVEM